MSFSGQRVARATRQQDGVHWLWLDRQARGGADNSRIRDSNIDPSVGYVLDDLASVGDAMLRDKVG